MVASLMHRRPNAHAWLLLATVLAAAGLGPMTARAQVPRAPLPQDLLASAKDGPRLTVDAGTVLEVVPNLAIVRLGVLGEADDEDAALLANAKIEAALIAKARQSGVEAKDIAVSRIKVSPRYEIVFVDGEETRGARLRGHTASNTMTVTIRDIPRAGVLIRDLFKEGANVIEDIEFTLTQDRLSAARAEVRALALKTAAERAELAALAAGVRLGKLIDIGTPPPADGAADLGAAPPGPADLGPVLVIEPGVIEIHDEVRAVWALER